jgi:hypothetical protein
MPPQLARQEIAKDPATKQKIITTAMKRIVGSMNRRLPRIVVRF